MYILEKSEVCEPSQSFKNNTLAATHFLDFGHFDGKVAQENFPVKCATSSVMLGKFQRHLTQKFDLPLTTGQHVSQQAQKKGNFKNIFVFTQKICAKLNEQTTYFTRPPLAGGGQLLKFYLTVKISSGPHALPPPPLLPAQLGETFWMLGNCLPKRVYWNNVCCDHNACCEELRAFKASSSCSVFSCCVFNSLVQFSFALGLDSTSFSPASWRNCI